MKNAFKIGDKVRVIHPSPEYSEDYALSERQLPYLGKIGQVVETDEDTDPRAVYKVEFDDLRRINFYTPKLRLASDFENIHIFVGKEKL